MIKKIFLLIILSLILFISCISKEIKDVKAVKDTENKGESKVIYPVNESDSEKVNKNPLEREPLSQKEQLAFLSTRTGGSMNYSFSSYSSFLYALLDVVIHSDDEQICNTELISTFPDFYKPTWREVFDCIARQTKSSWKYDSKLDYWIFSKPQKPLPFKINLTKNWEFQDRGSYVTYIPTIAPVGMDIYMWGTYSAPNKKEEQKLYINVRDYIALLFATMFKKDITTDDMQIVKVNNIEALYFKFLRSENNIVWRQWIIVEFGKAFAIVSSIKLENEEIILPDVKAMVNSFKINND